MIHPFLVTNNMFGYVDGTIPCPAKQLKLTEPDTVPKDNPNYPIWIANDAHVQKAYAPHTSFREYTLKTQLFNLKMKGDETPDAYLNRAQEYADALAVIGENVKDKYLTLLAISGLREEYNSLKSNITTLTPTTPSPSDSQAFYGARQLNHNNNRGNHRRGASRGYNNRGRGDSRNFNWASNQNTVYGTCHRCGIGHIPSQCPNRDPSTIRARPTANFVDSRNFSTAASNAWFPNTGANSHVTPDLASMDNSEAYHGNDALHVGNGMGLPILHIGSSKIYSPLKTFSISNILHGLYSLHLPQFQPLNKVAFSVARASSTI
ncbi:uncharacterized protein [Rutidosis leptorrhynchoides]|uniref:uncharacterized protein n=1 Tax=Rutidosis leptorrhynchoides TaxID=125765 RepID=UPI003A9A0509